DWLAVGIQGNLTALAEAATRVHKLHAHLVLSWRKRAAFHHEVLEAAPVVAVLEFAVLCVQTPTADVSALGDDDPLGALLRHHDFRSDRVRLVLNVEYAVFRQASHPLEKKLRISFNELGPAGG